MNKGLAIGIGIALVIGGIGIAAISSFVSLDSGVPESGSEVGLATSAEVTVVNATEQEEFPPRVNVSASIDIGVSDKPP